MKPVVARLLKKLKSTQTVIIVAGLAALLSFQNCSEVQLTLLKAPQSTKKPRGELCAQPPPNLQNLHRFLFFIDNSGSMEGLDPGLNQRSKRTAALRDFVEKFKADDNFTISIGSIHKRQAGYLPDPDYQGPPGTPVPRGACKFYKPRLPEDYTEVTKALDHIDIHAAFPDDNTPFLGMFDRIHNCVETDINASGDAQYSIVFVTDAAPTDTTLNDVREKVKSLVELGADQVTKISRINIYFLFLDNFNSSPDAASLVYESVKAAQNAGGLRSKANVLDITGPFDYSSIGIYERPKYKLQKLVVTNLHSAVDKDGTLAVDSDGDGVPDATEIQSGLNPTNYYGNGKCSDLSYMRGSMRCPSTCQETSKYFDSDHDGLSDCDESMVGSNPSKPDTDGDGILDSLEYRLGMSVIDAADPLKDPDGDGVTNEAEANRNTSPFIDDRRVAHKALTDISVREYTNDNGDYCYSVNINGLPIFPTLDVPVSGVSILSHAANENILRFLFFEVPETQPSATPLILEGFKSVYYTEASQGVLLDETVDLKTEDFVFINDNQ